LIEKGTVGGNPFFQLAPTWAVYPLVVLATIATIIASQAIITGSFSMTRQAMQLDWLPGVNIRQTSDRVYGQIYVPAVNWLMMVATVGITIAFQSSAKLAGAYGTAVSTTMLLTTFLLYTAMRKVWRWSLAVSILIAGVFLVVDMSFFCANLLKIAEGGWLPLTLGALVFFIMFTWRSGINSIHKSFAQKPETSQHFLDELQANRVPRVPGTAVFLTRTTQQVPFLLTDYVKHTGALHESVVTLTVVFEETPRVVPAERCSVEKIATGIWHVAIRFGFVEIPDLCAALYEVPDLDPSIDLENAVYFGARDQVVNRSAMSLMPSWRVPLFAFLYRNAVKAVDRFNLPSQRVVEIGRQIEV
jgi:KUP system potassium uptake protein